ncbi:MAG: ABC transporter permease subunit [Candidatus Thermoplasmatota archaeon]|nr:ABC transporter permease subunit [Candidatus Thermoplasmatota archaeon]
MNISFLHHPIVLIAKKEIMDNIRNKWILLMTGIFAALTLLISYFGSLGQGWQDLGLTIAGMMALVQYLIPIIGLMLGYAAIVGEIERGSMSALLSFPLKRIEVLIGKFLGLGGVLSFSLLVGFGIAGIVISANVSEVDIGQYLIFLLASVLLGLVFVALSLLASSFFHNRSTAMGLAIFLWFFFTMIWGIIMLGVAMLSMDVETAFTSGFPDWYYAINIINPISAYGTLVSLNVGPVSSSFTEQAFSNPAFYSSELMATILFLWIAISLIIAYIFFKKRDI